MKLLKTLNYALLINTFCCLGYAIINLLYFFKWSWIVFGSAAATMILFAILLKVENRINKNKSVADS